MQMLVHHVLALLFLYLTFAANMGRLAALGAFSHELAPTLIEIAKMIIYMNRPPPAAEVAFGFFAAAWVLGRIVYFPSTYAPTPSHQPLLPFSYPFFF